MMKTDFKDFSHLMGYINKFIERNTNLKKECQYCGKPAQIRYNYDNPYHIQLVCLDCKRKNGFNQYYNRGKLISDLPIIDIRDYLTKDKQEREDRLSLTENNKQIIQSLLKTKLPKIEAIKEAGLTMYQYDRLVEQYKENIDSDIEDKLLEVFNKNRRNKLKTVKLKSVNYSKYPNNLYKIKIERNLSNKDICKLANNTIQQESISLISTGKTEPTMITKCNLAIALQLSVADIFPEDFLFDNVYNYADYLYFINYTLTQLEDIIKERKTSGKKKVIENIASEVQIKVSRFYEITSRRRKPNHQELYQIIDKLNLKKI